MFQVVLVVKHSGKCAQVDGASKDDGANISQWDCVDQDNVKWLRVTREDGLLAFINMASIKVMQVDGASMESGANVSQWEVKPDQQGALWRPEDAGDGLVLLVNGSSGKCLGVADGSDENGGNIVQLDCAREENMEWQIQELPAVQ